MILSSVAYLDIQYDPQIIISFETKNYYYHYIRIFDFKGRIKRDITYCFKKDMKMYYQELSLFPDDEEQKELILLENLSMDEIKDMIDVHLIRRRLRDNKRKFCGMGMGILGFFENF